MKKSTSARSHGTDIESDDSEDEPIFLSGDEIDAQGDGENESKAEGGVDSGGEVLGGKGMDEDIMKDGECEDVGRGSPQDPGR